MLSETELEKLFVLLEHTHSDKKANRDEKTRLAWLETLRPWNYDQVRAAAFRRAQTGNRFFPDAPEIAAFCPPPPAGGEKLSAGWKKQRESLARFREMQQLRRAAGLPGSAWEAKETGMTMDEYDRLLEAAGLDTEGIF